VLIVDLKDQEITWQFSWKSNSLLLLIEETFGQEIT
jgi:hypothetical protein